MSCEGFAADAARSEEQQDPREHYRLVLDDPSSPTYASLLRFTWRVVPENHRRIMGVRIGDQDTRAA
jgi:hypothetical protein